MKTHHRDTLTEAEEIRADAGEANQSRATPDKIKQEVMLIVCLRITDTNGSAGQHCDESLHPGFALNLMRVSIKKKLTRRAVTAGEGTRGGVSGGANQNDGTVPSLIEM